MLTIHSAQSIKINVSKYETIYRTQTAPPKVCFQAVNQNVMTKMLNLKSFSQVWVCGYNFVVVKPGKESKKGERKIWKIEGADTKIKFVDFCWFRLI
jgi:hypothetical protein